MRQFRILLSLAISILLTPCLTQNDCYSTDCQKDIDSSQAFGIKTIPDDLKWYCRLYCKYTEVLAPNGKPIYIFAQNEISNEQVLYARGILEFYLEDVPGSAYGSNKDAIANSLSNNGHILSMMNGYDGQYSVPFFAWPLIGQQLFGNETPAIGSKAYINNNYHRRDAAFEEIFHFVHDAGIGIDFPGALQGAVPEYQQKIRAATNNTLSKDKTLWASDKREADWLEELREEGSLTQEYIVSVIDSYYGLWGAFTKRPGGMWGIYVAKTHEEIAEKDPMDYALMEMFLNPYLTFESRIAADFEGTFIAYFDPDIPYTHKSQYLVNLTLTGSNDSGITANDQDNRLKGNQGNNILDGREGVDTVVVDGNYAEYDLRQNEVGLTLISNTGNSGTDILKNIELIQFTDKTLGLARL